MTIAPAIRPARLSADDLLVTLSDIDLNPGMKSVRKADRPSTMGFPENQPAAPAPIGTTNRTSFITPLVTAPVPGGLAPLEVREGI